MSEELSSYEHAVASLANLLGLRYDYCEWIVDEVRREHGADHICLHCGEYVWIPEGATSWRHDTDDQSRFCHGALSTEAKPIPI